MYTCPTFNVPLYILRMDSNVSHLEQLQMSEADTRRRLKMLGEHVEHLASLLYDIRSTLKEGQESDVTANTESGITSKTRKISKVIGFGKSK